jgi:hypothetical protein
MFYIACVPGLALALGMQFAVESPRWLFKVHLASHVLPATVSHITSNTANVT